MSIIYEPRGKAREYSELAANLYTGCKHGCTYCYCPSIMRKTGRKWSTHCAPRKNILMLLEKEAQKRKGDTRNILLSFMTDPYQSAEAARITREALLIFERHKLNVQILTKNGDFCRNDFDILERNGWAFAITAITKNDKKRKALEPGASSMRKRFNALRKAKEVGIKTWISIEPIIYPEDAIEVINEVSGYADKIKIGRWNYDQRAHETDWVKVVRDCLDVIEKQKLNYYVKNDLWKHADKETKNKYTQER